MNNTIEVYIKMTDRVIPNYLIQRQVARLEKVDNIIFGDKNHDNFVLITDEENVAAYVQGKTGDDASIIPITTNVENYNLWIVHTQEGDFDSKNIKNKWIANQYNWKKFVAAGR
jgi:hypothetical protein